MSIRFLADADLNQAIVAGVRTREAAIDFLSAVEAELDGVRDSAVLELAAHQGRILVSHDTSTMPANFAARLQSGLTSPGILLVPQKTAIGPVVEALLLIWSASEAWEWANQIRYLPSLSRHAFR